MAVYAYPSTERVIFGSGSLAGIGAECDRLGLQRVLLLSTPSLDGSQVEGAVREALGARCAAVSRGSTQHVPSPAVQPLIELGRELRPDGIVTVGGGSVTDSAKAVAASLAEGLSEVTQLRERRIIFSYPDDLKIPALTGDPIPILSVPTTLSAAEYDGIFGITHEQTKDLYADSRLSPRIVFLDAAATHETPMALWRASGIRALDHAVEIYLSRAPTPITDATSLHAVRLLFTHLPREDDASRLACLEAGWLSMLGVDNVSLGLSHGIGHQIGARCGVPHGVTSCVMLPTVMERMVDVTPQRLADLARVMDSACADRSDAEAARRAPGLVREFIASLGLPTRLSEAGVSVADHGPIADDAMGDFVVAFAPLTVSREEILALLARAQ